MSGNVFRCCARRCVLATASVLLLTFPAVARAQGAGSLSCNPEGPPGPSGASASEPQPECWEGTLQARAQGNVYNDTADGKFKFTVADEDTVNGTAHIRMSHAPQTMPGGCVFTRTQDPEEFDVSIDGRRNGHLFELNFGTAKATYNFTTACSWGSRTSSGPGMDAFTGGSDIVLHDYRPALRGGPAKVPAEDASTTLHGSPGGDLRMTATITLACKRGCILPRAAD
jgi:hypothetical protein